MSALARGLDLNGVDGIGTVTRNMISGLKNHPELDVLPVSFGYSGYQKIDRNAPGITCGRYSIAAALGSYGNISFRESAALSKRIDLFHAPDHYIPKLKNIPVIATIHDAIPFSHPEWTTPKFRYLYGPTFKRCARWATKIITVSNFSKLSISEHFGIQKDRIHVIPNSIDPEWIDTVDPANLIEIKKKYRLYRPYIVSVGTLQPRKNIERVIAAFSLLPKILQQNYDLVIVGREGWRCEPIIKRLRAGAPHGEVRWLKYIPRDELLTLVKAAKCLVFPSLAEGFGLPVVEAFAARLPVLTSSYGSALPEVAGDAAVLVDPYDVSAISDGLCQILENTTLCDVLISRGLRKLKDFNFKSVISDTVRLYESVI